MSTIEKAVGKLEQSRKAREVQESAADARGDTIAKALASQDVPEQSPGARSTVTGARASEAAFLELPLTELAENGMVTPLAPRSRIAEEFRAIKRPLLRNIDHRGGAPVPNANLIMVTSALQGDGKTFTAINLAMSVAMEQDKTVLFVDADVSKATAGSILGIDQGSPGLIDVLDDKGVGLSDVIIPTSIDNLRIIPAGNVHERSTELLAGKNMQHLMLEMASRYLDRVVIFDSPPLLLTTEASVLASFMGQIVFVVSTDQTPQEAVTKALEHIGEDKVVGTVLNKAHARRNRLLGLGYGYGYGYAYGYGYGSEDRTRSAE